MTMTPSLTQESGLAPVTVFWDIESCPVPSTIQGIQVVSAIKRFSLSLGRLKNISAFGDLKTIPQNLRVELQESGVLMHEVANGKSNAADIAILVEILKLVCDHKPPQTIVLISGDRDFANVLNTLLFRHYVVYLIHSQQASPVLQAAATASCEWRNFLSNYLQFDLKSFFCGLTDQNKSYNDRKFQILIQLLNSKENSTCKFNEIANHFPILKLKEWGYSRHKDYLIDAFNNGIVKFDVSVPENKWRVFLTPEYCIGRPSVVPAKDLSLAHLQPQEYQDYRYRNISLSSPNLLGQISTNSSAPPPSHTHTSVPSHTRSTSSSKPGPKSTKSSSPSPATSPSLSPPTSPLLNSSQNDSPPLFSSSDSDPDDEQEAVMATFFHQTRRSQKTRSRKSHEEINRKTASIEDKRRETKRVGIQVEFEWPHGGNQVYLTGSFSDWKESISLQKLSPRRDSEAGNDATDCRTHSVILYLLPGEYQYKFIVDGEWRYDPRQPVTNDDFKNNKIIVRGEK